MRRLFVVFLVLIAAGCSGVRYDAGAAEKTLQRFADAFRAQDFDAFGATYASTFRHVWSDGFALNKEQALKEYWPSRFCADVMTTLTLSNPSHDVLGGGLVGGSKRSVVTVTVRQVSEWIHVDKTRTTEDTERFAMVYEGGEWLIQDHTFYFGGPDKTLTTQSTC